MQTVIICGGLATRLKKLSKNTPKSMIKIKGKPFLEYQLEDLKRQNVKDILLCVGHLSEHIQDYFKDGEKFGLNLTYSHDGDKALGAIGSIKNAEEKLEDVFFTLYGDSYVFLNYKELYNHFNRQNQNAMMTVFQNNNKYDKSNIILNRENMILQYSGEKKPEMIYIDYGVSIFRKKVFDQIPKDTFYSTKDLYTNLVNQKQLQGYKVKKRFYHIGTPEALNEFSKFINSK